MRVPQILAESFSGKHGSSFENWIAEFLIQEKLIENKQQLYSPRFLTRSVVPHVQTLSSLFNREEGNQSDSIEARYWTQSSNPKNLRLAYFLHFMPCNLFRIASIFAELKKHEPLLFSKQSQDPGKLKVIELGSGPAAASSGFLIAQSLFEVFKIETANFALIEKDKSMLKLGESWLQFYSRKLNLPWSTRSFTRELKFTGESLLPSNAPRFNLWLLSFVLNEINSNPKEIANSLIQTFENHLEDNSLVVIAEPALKMQSRKLLEVRAFLKEKYEILLPCLGNQICGALQNPEDWCHEEVTWWRPGYFRELDKLTKLDRKTLPFSYLVLTNNKNKAKLKGYSRLVSPSYNVGKFSEFYVCNQSGKAKARVETQNAQDALTTNSKALNSEEFLNRGDIILSTKIQELR